MKGFKIKNILFCVLALVPLIAEATIPDGYYDKAEGKKDAELKTILFQIIRSHTQVPYLDLPTYFQTTDWNPAGYFWDMYSLTRRSSFSGLNREHNLPKSWFGVISGQEDAQPIGDDLHNLYPSDRDANTAKSNYPPGEVSTTTFDNGSFKVGKNNFSGYSGQVFEPENQYKGDFARDYMYMVTCYEDYATRWTSTGTLSVLKNNKYPVFSTYGINLLLKWHRNDAVDSKEINRNDAVYGFQHNRNPFIDHPEFAEYIWGKYKGYAWWSADNGVPETDNDFKAWYNSETQTLNVKLRSPLKATYMLQSMDGSVHIIGGTFDTTGASEINISLEKGIYIVTVYTKITRKVQKLVVS